MAQITLSLPAPSHVDSHRVDWAAANTSYGDVSALAAVAGTVLLRNLTVLNHPTIEAQMRLASLQTAPDTTTAPFTVGPELSADWETNLTAITIRAPTLSDLVLPGPNTAGTITDDSEPYTWQLTTAQWNAVYGGNMSGQQWITDFNDLTSAQQGMVTLILDDGVAPDNFAHLGTAGIAKAYLGSTEITKIYLGSTEVL